jgi:hypothetical protein
MTKIFALPLGLIWTVALLAQDYPYDNPAKPTTTDTQAVLPKETPLDAKSSVLGPKNEPIRSLVRYSMRFGANWSYFESPGILGTNSTSGFGLEGIVGIGWDFRFYPAFLEFETGYRQHFLTATNPFHIVPVGFGTYFRSRLGARSILKYGFRGGLDIRYATYTNGLGGSSLSWGVLPYWGLGLQYEMGSFVIEPFVYFNRIQTSMNFVSSGLRTGLRF